jgi:hypothetical protein
LNTHPGLLGPAVKPRLEKDGDTQSGGWPFRIPFHNMAFPKLANPFQVIFLCSSTFAELAGVKGILIAVAVEKDLSRRLICPFHVCEEHYEAHPEDKFREN